VSTTDFAVVSWSSPKNDAASTDRISPPDGGLGIDRVDRRQDGAFRHAGVVPDDGRILEIVELICHNVASGKGLGERQAPDSDSKTKRDACDDDDVDERSREATRVLDHLIKLINDT